MIMGPAAFQINPAANVTIRRTVRITESGQFYPGEYGLNVGDILTVTIVGGGGGGSAGSGTGGTSSWAQHGYGGGGGGGGEIKIIQHVLTSLAPISITIGKGGSGGTPSSPQGNSGGVTIFGDIQAAGGNGGGGASQADTINGGTGTSNNSGGQGHIGIGAVPGGGGGGGYVSEAIFGGVGGTIKKYVASIGDSTIAIIIHQTGGICGGGAGGYESMVYTSPMLGGYGGIDHSDGSSGATDMYPGGMPGKCDTGGTYSGAGGGGGAGYGAGGGGGGGYAGRTVTEDYLGSGGDGADGVVIISW